MARTPLLGLLGPNLVNASTGRQPRTQVGYTSAASNESNPSNAKLASMPFK